MTRVMPCKCNHSWQDRTYGRGMRVHNHAPGNRAKRDVWRCTVCKEEKEK